MEMSVPPMAPSANSSKRSTTVRRSIADFGDGYNQGSGDDGLNSISKTLPLTWNTLYLEQAADVDAFLVARRMP